VDGVIIWGSTASFAQVFDPAAVAGFDVAATAIAEIDDATTAADRAFAGHSISHAAALAAGDDHGSWL
jgi:hypothetical protein